ncbi:AfsR/SARP family transcriptional regulator [Kitasatospora sp. LaBMicrA B282]|uniref:AfsR/SARP family transcriptional regulator n=1 Tax=Kitasatospora sp. LaBMicrA B282 TaxID=3420949 RepID=UPI003D09E12C
MRIAITGLFAGEAGETGVTAMEFYLLGSLAVRSGDRLSIPKVSKQRKLLAVLILNANHMVRTQTLMKELWDENPPRSAAATLQTYISQLRRFLAEAGELTAEDVTNRILLTEPGGYLLRVDPERIDAARFEAEVARGRFALASQEAAAAVHHFREATGGWDGVVLENVTHGPVIEAQVRRLEQLWLSTVEQYFDLELRAGRHHEILAKLTGVAAANPLHENLHGQLMTALFRCGRRAAALESFRTLRTRLVEGLGLEPAPQLERLHQHMLTTDSSASERGVCP